MKKLVIIGLSAIAFGACGSAPEPTEAPPITNTKEQSKKVSETVASHTVERTPPPANTGNTAPPLTAPKRSETKKKFSRSGTPIDTKKFDDAIAEAKKASDAKPADDTAKKALGGKYFERGVALTAARQYAAAIGDFRKAVKLDPGNKAADAQIKMISSIYKSMNIEGPKPGEEPAALEFKGK